ncbi:MAG: hypothetical protein ACFE9R_05230 [Candidatus Hermodarchaeota archaeon]
MLPGSIIVKELGINVVYSIIIEFGTMKDPINNPYKIESKIIGRIGTFLYSFEKE